MFRSLTLNSACKALRCTPTNCPTGTEAEAALSSRTCHALYRLLRGLLCLHQARAFRQSLRIAAYMQARQQLFASRPFPKRRSVDGARCASHASWNVATLLLASFCDTWPLSNCLGVGFDLPHLASSLSERLLCWVDKTSVHCSKNPRYSQVLYEWISGHTVTKAFVDVPFQDVQISGLHGELCKNVYFLPICFAEARQWRYQERPHSSEGHVEDAAGGLHASNDNASL